MEERTKSKVNGTTLCQQLRKTRGDFQWAGSVFLSFKSPSVTLAFSEISLTLNKIKDIKPDAIAITGYHEPSLVFLLNGEVLLSSPQEVAIFMAEGKNNIGLVEDDALKEFLDISKELNSSIRTVEVIKGYNIAKGKHVKIHIFKNQTFDLR